MSAYVADEEASLSTNSEISESPRKRMRLETSARKSWSLTDRRTDSEVLQEMGVSLLDSDEDVPCEMTVHKPSKRKHDIENVNPNANSATSPRGKLSPRKCNSSPGPSRPKSPRSTDKCRALQPTEQVSKLCEEQTPSSLCQPQSALQRLHAKRNATPLGQEEELILSRLSASPPPEGADSFSALSDEMLLSVFRWLPKRTTANAMRVCKRWYRVACDETLWQRLDLGNKTISKEALGRILARKPVIVRLATSEIGSWNPTGPIIQSRVQFLDLSMCSVDLSTLSHLLARCNALRKLSVESLTLNDEICQHIGKCKNLETLNLAMAQGITPEGLTAILEGCVNILSLNISWCNLCEAALQVLVNKLPQRLQRLNVSGARIMTDDMVVALCARCPRLQELDASDCARLTGGALLALAALPLHHVALSRCYLLPPHALTKLNTMPALQYLDVWGMLQTNSLNALRSALPAIQINQFMFSAIARPTVGTRRTSIWGLRTRD